MHTAVCSLTWHPRVIRRKLQGTFWRGEGCVYMEYGNLLLSIKTDFDHFSVVI